MTITVRYGECNNCGGPVYKDGNTPAGQWYCDTCKKTISKTAITMTKKIFLAGPITAISTSNAEEFSIAAEKIRAMGHKVITPMEILDTVDETLSGKEDYVRKCVSELSLCDEVVTLMDWENCKDANNQIRISRIMSKPITPITKFLNPKA